MADITSSSRMTSERDAFNSRMQKYYPGNKDAYVRQLELKAAAKNGNGYAQAECRKDGLAEMSVQRGAGDTANLSGEAWGKVGDTLESIADHTSWGAQKNLRLAAQEAHAGHYKAALCQGLQATARIGCGAVQAYGEDVLLGGVVKGGSKVLGVSSKAMQGARNAEKLTKVISAGGAVSTRLLKHEKTITAVVGAPLTFLKPAVGGHHQQPGHVVNLKH